jgi:transcriptional regulator with PAS, ATPase and Fis domain
MPRRRFHAPELTRLLESVAVPLYVLDAQLRIVFVNEACRQWLGPAAEGLVGRQCVYHSGPEVSGPQAVAAGLCPPPAVLPGRELTAEVARPTDQGMTYCRARFVPIAAGESLLAVVAIVEDDSPEAKAPRPRSAWCPHPGVEGADDAPLPALHEHLRRFRQEVVLRKGMDCLVGSSPATRRARSQAELAADSPASVLLVGPPGSGRRRLAEAIHYGNHPESAGALLPLDCALLDADSLRSALRAVAPEGPPGARPASSSILLLDADRLGAEVQAEIAGLLFPPPGRAPCATFRLVATAGTTLGELVRHGRYREDLAAWLSTITIELPPLAQRREDIPLLAQALLEEGNARGGKQLAGFTPEALDRLDAYPWPGNIDELAQAVAEGRQRAAAPEIAAADLPERLRLAAEAGQRPPRKEETVQLDEFVARIQRELIRRALARAKGNKAKAARLLGLNRPRLYRRMAQLGLLKEE